MTGRGQLSTWVLGLELANPVLVGSGPLTDSLGQIRRWLAAGAGGVVTKTIYAGESVAIRERISIQPTSAFNSTTYSRVPLDRWVKTLEALAQERAPAIVSIHAETPGKLAELARTVVGAGAPALELGLCCPIDGSQEAADARLVGRYTAAVRAAVDVPLSVKLTALGGLDENVRAATDEGADAISLSDALPGVVVDPRRRTFPLGSSLGYSGPAIKPIVLHAIHQLRSSGVTCPILGIGGVASASDVVEYLEVGAQATQVYTVLMRGKARLLTTIVSELGRWCERERVTAAELVGTVRGVASEAAGEGVAVAVL